MPLFWFSLAGISGIFLSSFFNFSIGFCVSGCFVFLIVGFCEYRFFLSSRNGLLSQPMFRIPLAFLFIGFFIGCFSYQNSLPIARPNNVLGYVDTKDPVVLTGIVQSYPNKTSNYTSAVIKSESINTNGENINITGDLSLLLPAGFNIRFGDRVKLIGVMDKTYRDNTEIMDSGSAIQQIFVKMAFPKVTILSYGNGNRIIELIYNLRERALTIIYDLIPFPESAVLSGILLGIEGGIPEFLWDSYRSSGTVHIIAISGFNITIIMLLAFQSFNKLFGWKWTLPLTIGVVLFYTVLVGADPPVVRAAIMGIVALIAHYIGRRSIGIYSLVLTAFIMLLGNPFLLWSISFQLSFLATLALLTIVDPLDNWISHHLEKYFSVEKASVLMPVITIVSTTFSATLVILPILINLNPNISLINLLANFLIAPLQPMIMIFGGLAVFLGFLIPPNFNFLRFLVWPLIAFCDRIAIRLSMSSGAVILLPKFAFWVSLFLSIIMVLYFSFRSLNSLFHPKFDINEP